jgi:glutamate carboxypeptidase
MIAGSVRADPYRSKVMSVEAKTAIIEHLGRQHQAMVDLSADLVNIDSGSYNSRGVDAVGDRLRAWLEAAGIPCETFPNEILAIHGGAYSSAPVEATGRSC